jgi:hypothetical protein
MRLSLAAGVAAAILVSSAGVPAFATEVRVCTDTSTWKFSPALSVESVTGTFHVDWANTCVAQTASATPPGQQTQTTTSSGSFDGSYTGSCAIALLSGHLVATLTGGTVLAVVNSDGAQSQELLVPDEVCREQRATATGQAGYVTP